MEEGDRRGDPFLPVEIICIILSFVYDLKDLKSCRMVCRHLADLIDDLYVGHAIQIRGTDVKMYHEKIHEIMSTFPKIDRLYLFVNSPLDYPISLRNLQNIKHFSYVTRFEQPFDCSIVPCSAKKFYLDRRVSLRRHETEQPLQNIKSLPPLVHLEVYQYNIPPSGIACLPNTLQILHIETNMSIPEAWSEEFTHLTNLKTLSLWVTGPRILGYQNITFPSSLTHLSIGPSSIILLTPIPNLIYLSSHTWRREYTSFKNIRVLILNRAIYLSEMPADQFKNLPENIEHLELVDTSIPRNILSILPPRLQCLNIDGSVGGSIDLYDLPASIRSLTVRKYQNNIETIPQDHKLETLVITGWTHEDYVLPRCLPNHLRELCIHGWDPMVEKEIQNYADMLAYAGKSISSLSYIDRKLNVYGRMPMDKHVHDMDCGLIKNARLEYTSSLLPGNDVFPH